jgi:hypothetical protein
LRKGTPLEFNQSSLVVAGLIATVEFASFVALTRTAEEPAGMFTTPNQPYESCPMSLD